MPPRASNWGWNPAGRRRYLLILLWLGHGAWVAMGPRPGHVWTRIAGTLARPAEGLASRWEAWRTRRQDRARSLAQLQVENASLRAQLAALQLAEAQQAPRLAEAGEAERILGLRQQIPLALVGARVIFSTRPEAFGGLILEGGRDRGFVPDQGVIAPEGVVGRLWSVGPTQSKVLPADAPNASVGVMLARSRATGVLQGLGSGQALIRYLSNQEVVQVGEAVYTSGLDRVFPRGLLVGYVTRVEKGELELRVTVQLAAPLDRLHLVLVLPPQPPLEVQEPFVAPTAPAAPSRRGTP
ncbi:MAG: rod shape-determining protein MreC [Acidobacteriota bacterium]|nr:rod shape-determining protein MreC [Acidobacteriota bacterium]